MSRSRRFPRRRRAASATTHRATRRRRRAATAPQRPERASPASSRSRVRDEDGPPARTRRDETTAPADGRDEPFPPRGKKRPARGGGWDVARLYIGAGRTAKVRPADLVGAIANEAGIDARAIGAIQIADRFSIVEVPEEIADDVVAALRASTIKGRQVLVRRDRA